MRQFNAIKNAINFGKGKRMKITESKETVNVENVKPMEPQIVRILDNKGMQIAFVCIGYKATSVNIGICQEDNFKLEVEKEEVTQW